MELHPATTLKGKKGEGRRELKELWREREVSFAARRQLFLSFCNGGCIAARAHHHPLEDKYSPHVIGIAEMRQSRIRARALARRSLIGTMVKSGIC